MNTETTPAALGNSAKVAAAPLLSIFDEVEQIRSQIETATEELAWAENSALPKAEAKKRASAAFAAQANSFCLPVWQFAEPKPDGNILREMMEVHSTAQIFRALHGQSDESGSMSLSSVSVNLTELMLALFGDELLAKMHKQIDALDYVAGPPSKDRPAMIERLKDALRDLGAKEEALIEAGEERGTFIPRRADADPAIVLGYIPDGARQDSSGASAAPASGALDSLDL